MGTSLPRKSQLLQTYISHAHPRNFQPSRNRIDEFHQLNRSTPRPHRSSSSGKSSRTNYTAVNYQQIPTVPLDTIDISEMKRSGSSSSDPSKMLQTGESPRSIERMHVHSRGDDKNNIRGSGSNPSLSGSNHSQKEDSTAQTIQVRTDGSNVVPSTIIGPPRAPSPRDGMVSMSVDPHHPFVKPIDRPHSDHRRAESWSGQYPPICPPSPALSMQGAPLPMGGLIPPFALNTLDPNFISTETRSLLASTAPLSQSSRPFSQQRKRKSGNVRYRSLSSGTPHPGHPGLFAGNQFYDYSNITMPPPPPPPPPRRHQSERFSPRQEFMKLSSGFRGTPPSPSVRKVAVSPQGSKPRSMHSSMRSHSRSNSINGKVTFSPQYNMPPPSPGGMSYGSINQSLIPDFPSEGGEALFMAQKNSARHHIHRESSRMRHMRQQSAQLFMEEVKGHEQPPACRDIVFLLLFLFHIVGIVFLGETYGPGALDSTPDDGTSSTEDEVKLSSSSMIYIAVASGLFAMLASAMALGLMTAIARRFVQVALCLAVMISFAWGTIGTGYSPRTVVPVTGFIALAMSVAYTFIVWERIPFSAANLVTALSGIKANFSTLLVALSFQAITLAYCVYYTFVVAGVYDAIQDGKLSASTKMQYFIYTMLGVSFYWTYNIILVSRHSVLWARLYYICSIFTLAFFFQLTQSFSKEYCPSHHSRNDC